MAGGSAIGHQNGRTIEGTRLQNLLTSLPGFQLQRRGTWRQRRTARTAATAPAGAAAKTAAGICRRSGGSAFPAPAPFYLIYHLTQTFTSRGSVPLLVQLLAVGCLSSLDQPSECATGSLLSSPTSNFILDRVLRSTYAASYDALLIRARHKSTEPALSTTQTQIVPHNFSCSHCNCLHSCTPARNLTVIRSSRRRAAKCSSQFVFAARRGRAPMEMSGCIGLFGAEEMRVPAAQ